MDTQNNKPSLPAKLKPTTVPTPIQNIKVKNPRNFRLFTVGATILLAVFAVLGYYFMTKDNLISNYPSLTVPTTTSLPSQTADNPLFSGQLKRIDKNLGIFKISEDSVLNGITDNPTFYEAGIFLRGELKDYTRIIAIESPMGPSDPRVFTLATKDFQKYYLDDPDEKTQKYPQDDYDNPFSSINKEKIISIKTFDNEHPKTINLNQKFSLYASDFPIESVATKKIDNNGNTIYDTLLTIDYDSYQKLDSPNKQPLFYFKPIKANFGDINQLPESEKNKINLREKYVLGDSEILVVDSSGLPLTYSETTPDNIKNYSTQKTEYEIALKKYEELVTEYNSDSTKPYPQYPNYVPVPNFSFQSNQIDNRLNLAFYNDYQTAIPGACSTKFSGRVINVHNDELEEIGSVLGLPLYRLKNKQHELYTLSYSNKMDYYLLTDTWEEENSGQKPSLTEYIEKNPLLFVRDYWGRWVGMGEFFIKMPGGCGKPVIYLYPEETTKISLKFKNQINFTVDIPKYTNSWEVMAQTNGNLTDLKAQLTDCTKIDTSSVGSAYALQACQKNSYPYLYWAGSTTHRNLPSTAGGWVIKKENLSSFFKTTLSGIGLNQKEQDDFTEYWLTDMLSKNAPFYKISFLQTQEVNSLFPMTVNPQPNTVFRIFMDYSTLENLPNKMPEPQKLDKLIRNGFTLVEWGGLEKP